MAKTIDYPDALPRPEYYVQRYTNEQGTHFYGVYERIIPNEEGICVWDSTSAHHAHKYKDMLNG